MPKRIVQDGYKWCYACTTEYLATPEFWYRDTSKSDGFFNRCKSCARVRHADYMSRNPGLKRKYRVKYQYGLTLDEFTQLKSQYPSCAICHGKNDSARDLHVDHCHKTNKVRGLLCHRCNSALGFFNDNIELMTKAIEYIKEHSD